MVECRQRVLETCLETAMVLRREVLLIDFDAQGDWVQSTAHAGRQASKKLHDSRSLGISGGAV